VLFFLSSCQPHDPFCFHHPHGAVLVEYDWTGAPDAGEVNGTTVHFYRADDGRQETTAHFSGREGGSLYLGEGEYDVVAYNNDTERLHWRGTDSLSTLETYTRNASLTEELPGYAHGPIAGLVLTPDRLWSGRRERVRVSRNDTTVILLAPRKVTYEVIWEVTGIREAERVTASAASVSGVGGTLFLDEAQTDRHGALMSGVGSRLPGNAAKGGSDSIGGFAGRFEVFGCPFRDTCKHVFTLYCWSKGGNVKASFDVRE